MAAKKAPAKKAPAKKVDGDALARTVLGMLGIKVEEANETSPSVAMPTLMLESEQTAKAYGKAKPQFAKVPSFHVELANAAPSLVVHVKSAEAAWAAARFAKQKGEGRVAMRKQAEMYRSDVLRTARFLFRRDKSALAEVERIAKGEGLADLVRDHEELATLATTQAEAFAMATKLGDVAARCTAFAETLKTKRDDTEAHALHEARNRAVVALDASLDEIRSAARFLYEGNAAAMAPYLSTHAASRLRRTK